jgi:hypothetical protein
MKKTLIITVIVTLLFCIGILAIPKHEMPTDEEWETYLEELNSEKSVLSSSLCFPAQ